MTKNEAVHLFVDRMQAVPQRWVECVAEHIDGNYPRLPMWGTMFVTDFSDDYLEPRTKEMTKENFPDDFDEEMEGERVFVDKDGDPTNVYWYIVDGDNVIGVHGAGYDFYDGVWDRLYDILDMQWHEDADEKMLKKLNA